MAKHWHDGILESAVFEASDSGPPPGPSLSSMSRVTRSAGRLVQLVNTLLRASVALAKNPSKGSREHDTVWQALDMVERELTMIRRDLDRAVGKP